MGEIGDAYTITVSRRGASVSALVAARHVDEWLEEHGAAHAVTGTVRALLHRLVREVLDEQGVAR